MDLPQKAQIQVKTDLGALAQVLMWFDQFSHPPIPQVAWLQCQLILAEGFTNAVRHAHCGFDPETPIDIEVVLDSNHMTIRIWDFGHPFDLLKRLDSIPQEVDHNAEGGRGLRLMQRMSSSLDYRRVEGDRNCLTVVKQYQPDWRKPPN